MLIIWDTLSHGSYLIMCRCFSSFKKTNLQVAPMHMTVTPGVEARPHSNRWVRMPLKFKSSEWLHGRLHVHVISSADGTEGNSHDKKQPFATTCCRQKLTPFQPNHSLMKLVTLKRLPAQWLFFLLLDSLMALTEGGNHLRNRFPCAPLRTFPKVSIICVWIYFNKYKWLAVWHYW